MNKGEIGRYHMHKVIPNSATMHRVDIYTILTKRETEMHNIKENRINASQCTLYNGMKHVLRRWDY